MTRPGKIKNKNNNGGGHGRPDDYGDGRGASCERGNASFCDDDDYTDPVDPVDPVDPIQI